MWADGQGGGKGIPAAVLQIEIGLLQKEKRKREEELVRQKQEKEDARAFKKANSK